MKKHLLFAMGILALATNVQSKEWYQEKGTLHDATMKQWCKADDKNKLVTAGDFVAQGYQKKLFKTEIIEALDKSGMNGVKVLAQEVVDGLNESSCNGKKAIPESANQKVGDMAAMLIMMMQWLK